jgi:RNA polymerase sigma-70 factor (ECF subfamily)
VLGAGDERAFGVLYDRHTPYLYGLALRLAGGEAAMAEEITHEAWVRAAARLDRFEWRSVLRTWLAGFLIRCASEAVRQTGQEVALGEAVLETEDTVLSGALARVDLERAIARLAPGFRHVLVLHDIEGYTHEEVGQLLGIEPGTSKSQLSRARAVLRRSLGEREEP